MVDGIEDVQACDDLWKIKDRQYTHTVTVMGLFTCCHLSAFELYFQICELDTYIPEVVY